MSEMTEIEAFDQYVLRMLEHSPDMPAEDAVKEAAALLEARRAQRGAGLPPDVRTRLEQLDILSKRVEQICVTVTGKADVPFQTFWDVLTDLKTIADSAPAEKRQIVESLNRAEAELTSLRPLVDQLRKERDEAIAQLQRHFALQSAGG